MQIIQTVKNNYKTYIIIAILAIACLKMFSTNYRLQSPVISAHKESYESVWSERIDLMREVEELKRARDLANQDI